MRVTAVHVYRVNVLWIPLDCRERSSGSLTHCGTQSTCCHFRCDENGSRVTWFRQFENKKRNVSHKNILSIKSLFSFILFKYQILHVYSTVSYRFITNLFYKTMSEITKLFCDWPCRVGSVGSVSASRTVGREFASRPGHTKDHHKNGTNCLPA